MFSFNAVITWIGIFAFKFFIDFFSNKLTKFPVVVRFSLGDLITILTSEWLIFCLP